MIDFSSFCLCIKCPLLRELSPVPPTYISLLYKVLQLVVSLLTRAYYNLLLCYLLAFYSLGPISPMDCTLLKFVSFICNLRGWASAGHTVPSIIVEPMNGSSGYSIISGFHFLLSSKQQLPCTHTGTLNLEELE